MKKEFGFGFGFHTQNCLILCLGHGLHTHIFGVLGVGMKPKTQNQNPYFFGCECYVFTSIYLFLGSILC